ncbi:hypothetical protein KW791_02630 [Candidatus Parcubacteria bacterium]|nr:hypothetical protein [Candidatus Parcubacteria bacterium]
MHPDWEEEYYEDDEEFIEADNTDYSARLHLYSPFKSNKYCKLSFKNQVKLEFLASHLEGKTMTLLQVCGYITGLIGTVPESTARNGSLVVQIPIREDDFLSPNEIFQNASAGSFAGNGEDLEVMLHEVQADCDTIMSSEGVLKYEEIIFIKFKEYNNPKDIN